MEVWLIWIVVGVGFLIWEIFTPGFVVGNIGIGCLAGGLASYLDGSLTVQIFAFALMNLIGFIFIRPFFKKILYRGGDRKKLGVQALIGRTGEVVGDILPGEAGGRVKLGGEEWKAVSGSGEIIEKGRTVEVVRIESTVITVTPIKEHGHE